MFGRKTQQRLTHMRQEFTSIMNAEANLYDKLTLSHLKLRDQVSSECDRVNKKFTNHGITLWKLKRGLGNVCKSLKVMQLWSIDLEDRVGPLQAKVNQQQAHIDKLIDSLGKYINITDRLCDIVAGVRKKDAAECAQGGKEIKAILDYLDANMDKRTCLVTARKKDKLTKRAIK